MQKRQAAYELNKMNNFDVIFFFIKMMGFVDRFTKTFHNGK